jgi:hypothetical protein
MRDGEMVLEIECPGDRPYVIVGKAMEGFFRERIKGCLMIRP